MNVGCVSKYAVIVLITLTTPSLSSGRGCNGIIGNNVNVTCKDRDTRCKYWAFGGYCDGSFALQTRCWCCVACQDERSKIYTEADQVRIFEIFLLLRVVCAGLSFILNLAVCFVFTLTLLKGHFKLPNAMLTVQAVSDLVVAIGLVLSTLFYYHYHYLRRANTSLALQQSKYFLYEYSKFLGITILLLITIERFLSVKRPLFHRQRITPTKMFVATFICFILSPIPAICRTLLWGNVDPGKGKDTGPYFITMGAVTLVMLFTVYVLLFVSYKAVKRSINFRLRHSDVPNTDNVELGTDNVELGTEEKRKQMRVIKILFSICTLYGVTFIPVTLWTMLYLHIFPHIHYIQDIILENLMTLTYYLSAIANPVLTLMFKEDFRDLLKLKCCA